MEDVVLEVYRERRPGVIHVTLAGEMDEAAVDRLQGELRRLRSVLVKTIVLDLRRARRIGSDTLRVVGAGVLRAEEAGQHVVVVREPGTLPHICREAAVLEVPLGTDRSQAAPSGSPHLRHAVVDG